jgi:hypothetical protein
MLSVLGGCLEPTILRRLGRGIATTGDLPQDGSGADDPPSVFITPASKAEKDNYDPDQYSRSSLLVFLP